MRGLFKTAGAFGVLLTLSHVAHHARTKSRVKKQKKKAKKRMKKMENLMRQAQEQMEELNANPPVRIPVPPDSWN